VEGEEIKVSEFCPEVQANLSALKAVRNCRMWGAQGVFMGVRSRRSSLFWIVQLTERSILNILVELGSLIRYKIPLQVVTKFKTQAVDTFQDVSTGLNTTLYKPNCQPNLDLPIHPTSLASDTDKQVSVS
jgi:hypothetical protein